MSADTLIKVYGFLERVTPLKKDCGKLCEHKCCNGSDKDGMLLFPGEERFFECDDNFTVYYDEVYGLDCVRCNGSCDRSKRPLSCRIFPYFIYFTDKATVAPDMRAKDFCPLLAEDTHIDKGFLRALRISAKKLCADDEIKEFLTAVTEKLTDFNNL